MSNYRNNQSTFFQSLKKTSSDIESAKNSFPEIPKTNNNNNG